MSGQRQHSDEAYVIDLCDKVLGIKAQRQYRFEWLRGDSRTDKPGVPLPCDAYWESLNLVVEFHEIQHDHPVPIMDKRMTVSGVRRGMQRKIYDRRRKIQLPRHGITLIVISIFEFMDAPGRITRTAADAKKRNLRIVREHLAKWIDRARRLRSPSVRARSR